MVNTIERIHADFSVDLMEAMRDVNETALLQRVKPALVKFDTFAERVEYYRQHYPQHNFVTENQITEICNRYKLVFGSLMGFSATIPLKNRLEINRFKLRDADSVYTDHDLPNRLFRLAMDNGVGSSMSSGSDRGRSGVIEFRTGYEPADPNKPFEVIPVGQHFTLLMNPDEETYRVFLEVDVHGSPWFVEYGTVSMRAGQVWFRWQAERVGRSIVQNSEVSLRLCVDHIQRANRLSLMHNVSPMVVADQTMFKRFGDATEIVGHRVKFKRSQVAPTARMMFVDDPIILQPVPFGYLVVTKWGTEANIPDFIAPASN